VSWGNGDLDLVCVAHCDLSPLVVLALACAAVHGRCAHFAPACGEDLIDVKHAVVAAQGLAAVMAHRIDLVFWCFRYMTLCAFPAQFASWRPCSIYSWPASRRHLSFSQGLFCHFAKLIPDVIDACPHCLVGVSAADGYPDLRIA